MSLQDAKFASAISEMQEMHESELQQVRDPPILEVGMGGGGTGFKKRKKKKKGDEKKKKKRGGEV